jgi:hypothetical protein
LRAVQAHLARHLDHLADCTVDFRFNSITIHDFSRKELVSLCAQTEKKSLEAIRMDPSLWAPFFPLFSAFLTHSSAVIRNGGAIVFLAPDEGGKTTAARTAPPESILSDDQNVIRKENGSFFVHSTPWSLFYNGIRRAPLRAFFLLEKAPAFKLAILKPRGLVDYLWQEHLNASLMVPKAFRAQTFDLVCDIAKAAPAFVMHLPKGYVDWDAVDRAMNPA